LSSESVLEIIAYGAWNDGIVVDNSIFENKGMFFKGGKPVNNETIEERIGVRTRIAAPEGESIGIIAMQDLLESSDIDPFRIKLFIGATNLGEDKNEPGPLSRHIFELVRHQCPDAIVLDLYAGCPGFNLAVELVFCLSLVGILKKDDLSVIVGAENIHRVDTFRPLDTANIIFGDDALATALETKTSAKPTKGLYSHDSLKFSVTENFIDDIAKKLFELNGQDKIDGIIIDNQLGKLQYKVPATAARVQHRLIELMYPEEASKGGFNRFKDALAFYDDNVNSFGFDIMTLGNDTNIVKKIARAYVESGKYRSVASIYLAPDLRVEAAIHKGKNYTFERPRYGIVDTLTRTHGCFADYIQVVVEDGDVFAEIDGKGVFLHATRGAKAHLTELLSRNNLALNDVDLIIEHQANFAIIPMTLEKLLGDGHPNKDTKEAVADYIANKMVTNIHERGNCSVVCMQRLPYDLQRGALKEDMIQGYPVNRNLDNLRAAKIILNDSIGTGMTRSSVLQRRR
jgi:3-oxoacyl-[acyl-carrier-protein] synthase III